MSSPVAPDQADERTQEGSWASPTGLADSRPRVLAARRLQVSFPGHDGKRAPALDDVSIEVQAGEMLGIVGESGCGKSTLAKCLVGLVVPQSGEISLEGTVLGQRRSRPQRQAVQLVFQDPFSSLNPRLSVRSMLLELLAFDRVPPEEREGRARELMQMVGLPADALERYPSAFSGGQRQRVAIARAIAVGPRFLVADEPISALDVSVQAAILELFSDIKTRLCVGTVLISHNLAAVRQVCDRVAVMYLGRVVEIGKREEIFEDPRHPYTKALLSAAPRVRGAGGRPMLLLKGEPPSTAARPSGCPFHPRCPRAEPTCADELPALLPAPRGGERLAACQFREES